MALAEWKYKNPKQEIGPGWYWRGWALAAGVMLLGAFAGFGPIGVVPVGIAIVVSIRRKQKIKFYSRYLITGKDIVYFENISRILCDPQRLLVTHLNGKVFELNAKYFQSNARKAEKIAWNQCVKLSRVASYLIEQTRKVNPSVEISQRSNP